MEKQIQKKIHINASPEQVWDTLTKPDKIAQDLHGVRTLTDWEEGSPIDYYIEKDGQEFGVVKGTILTFEPPRYLENTLFPIGWENLEDTPKNYLTSSYELTPIGGGVDLTLIIQDYTKVAMGEIRYQDTLKSIDGMLNNLKAVAERA